MQPDDRLILIVALVAMVTVGWAVAGLILMVTIRVCGL